MDTLISSHLWGEFVEMWYFDLSHLSSSTFDSDLAPFGGGFFLDVQHRPIWHQICLCDLFNHGIYIYILGIVDQHAVHFFVS